MIKAVYCNVKDLDLEKSYSLLPESRRKKAESFIFDKDKKLSCGVYLLLRKLLEEENIEDPIIKTEKEGKPYISNYDNIHFNMSHAGKMVACAISDEEIGIDIEKIDPLIDMKIAQTFFYNSEYEDIKKSDDKVDKFFKYWVLKESYMKYTGLGFNLDLDSFEIIIENEEENEIHLKENPEDVDLKFNLFNVEDYKIGIASHYDVPDLIEYDLDDLY